MASMISKHLQDQAVKNDELEKDLEAAQESRKRYQLEARALQQQATKYKKETEELTTKNQFVVLLVDGDGAKFCDDLLNAPDPALGAQKAGENLKKAVRDHLRQEDLSDDITIIVRVFAHISGLARALTDSDVVPEPNCMFTFAEKFTNACAEFDFVNVGWGKENADSKIRRNLAHYYNIKQCKKVFVAGCCHDNGYLHELRLYRDDPERKIVLVETTTAEPDFTKLGFPVVNFDTVFRSEPLNNETKRIPVRTISSSPTTSKALMKIPPQETPPPQMDTEKSFPALPPRPSGSQGSVIKLGTGTWSSKVGPQPTNIDLRSPKPKEQVNKIFYTNKEKQRVDLPVPKPAPTSDAQVSYQEKLDLAKVAGKNGLCNQHYLQLRCDSGDYCPSDHKPQLSRDELVIHRFRVRQATCYYGQSCVEPTCPFAHHCPYGLRCAKIRKGDCKHELHFADSESMPYWKCADGKFERVNM